MRWFSPWIPYLLLEPLQGLRTLHQVQGPVLIFQTIRALLFLIVLLDLGQGGLVQQVVGTSEGRDRFDLGLAMTLSPSAVDPLVGVRLALVAVEAVAVLEDLVAELAGDRGLDAVHRLVVPPVDPPDHDGLANRAHDPLLAVAAAAGPLPGDRAVPPPIPPGRLLRLVPGRPTILVILSVLRSGVRMAGRRRSVQISGPRGAAALFPGVPGLVLFFGDRARESQAWRWDQDGLGPWSGPGEAIGADDVVAGRQGHQGGHGGRGCRRHPVWPFF